MNYAARHRARVSWQPSLHLSATRALEAAVNGGSPEAIEAFREQLYIETGLSRDLVALLVSQGVLA